jgi:hypothetical protein
MAMAPWTIFRIAGLLLTLLIIGGLLLPRHKRLRVFGAQKLAGDACLLYLLLWLASLSILAYIIFAFGKR